MRAIRQHPKIFVILALSFGLLTTIGYFAWHRSKKAFFTPRPPQSDLTREKVSALAHAQMVKEVEAYLPRAILFLGKFGTYEDMRRAKVLDCSVSMFGKYMDCKPGPRGELFRLEGSVLTLPIGRKTPTVINVSQVDEHSALAEVILTFEPSKGHKIFKSFEQAFYKPRIQDEQHTVQLRLFDDGWRIEKID
jgi:hypothetical protein